MVDKFKTILVPFPLSCYNNNSNNKLSHTVLHASSYCYLAVGVVYS